MPYLRDRNKERLMRRVKWGVFLSLFLILISYLGFFKYTSSFFHKIGVPVWNIENSSKNTIGDLGYVVRTKASVYKENDILRNRNNELLLSMADYNILKTENDSLKEMLGRKPEKENFILGIILAKPNRSPYDTIIIDGGMNASMYKGQEVFAGFSIPIGVISEIYNNTALVKLYSSPGETLEAQIEGTNASVELLGRGGGNFEMMITKELNIIQGTQVIIPHLSSRVVAVVADIVSDDRSPMQKVILKSPVNIQELKWVEVKK